MIIIDSIIRYRLTLTKSVGASCHDFIQVLTTAVAQSGLKYHIKGAKPRVYVFNGAKQEEESLCEIAEIFLDSVYSPEEIKLKLSPFFEGSGFKCINVTQLPYRLSSLQNLVSFAEYEITSVKGNINEALLSADSSLKTHIQSISRLSEDKISLIVRLKPLGSVSLVQEFLKLPGLEVDEGSLQIKRVALFWVDKNGVLQPV